MMALKADSVDWHQKKQDGEDDISRRGAYKSLFHGHVDEKKIASIRSAWQTGTALGNDRFEEKIEETLKIKVGFARRG